MEWFTNRARIGGYEFSPYFDGDFGLFYGVLLGFLVWLGNYSGWFLALAFALGGWLVLSFGQTLMLGLFGMFEGFSAFALFFAKNLLGGILGWMLVKAIRGVVNRVNGLKS